MSKRKINKEISRIASTLDLRPIYFLVVLYTIIWWLPFGIFGWLQNEDGLMEWGSVALLILSAINAFRLQKQSQQGWDRIGWLLLFVLCCLFIGEEISWGERLHGAGIDAIRSINTQGETNLHNIAIFQGKGLLHLGWAGLGLLLGLAGFVFRTAPLIPARRFTLYFTLPAIWYLGFEFCGKAGECLITVANHQEIYELLIIAGLYLHTRSWCRKSGILTRIFGTG
ncbi:hypothetical protein N9C84_04245 [Desulfobacterales bacterium]|nr:hypothetical protein [Desulfobacterales bacterium]